MSTIRRQSIISSFVVYIGFALGFLNTYLYTREGGFSNIAYGLIGIFTAISQFMYSISNVGMSAYLTKFFPYYRARLNAKTNDQLAIALSVSTIGFVIVMILGVVFKDIIANKIFSNSPQLLTYYYWLFPFAFGFSLFLVFEAYAWQLHKAVVSNFLKEVAFRAIATVLILFTTAGLIKSFDTFIGLYSFAYLGLAIYLSLYFKKKRQLHLNFKPSIVTKKFRKKILALIGFVWSGGIIYNFANVVDTIIIAAVLPNGIAAAGVFTFGQYIASLIQAPQRAVISAAVGPLSQAWKDKDFRKLNKIYHRSAINQLLFASAMFCLIWINFEDGVKTFHLQTDYLQAKWIFFFLGLTRVLDMGTGLNAQIISTSSYWKFEFRSGMILLAVMLPLNYLLTVRYGLFGPAVANLFSFAIYNIVRYFFLLKKFAMQPFDAKTAIAVLLCAGCFLLGYLPFKDSTGLHWMIIRSLVFCGAFAAGMIYFKLSPDAVPVWQTLKKRLRLG